MWGGCGGSSLGCEGGCGGSSLRYEEGLGRACQEGEQKSGDLLVGVKVHSEMSLNSLVLELYEQDFSLT